MHLALDSCSVRDWTVEDATSLVRHANNRNIWINVRDRFPHPYRLAHAREFLTRIVTQLPRTTWAIEADGQAVGGIGVMLMSDVERVSAELGYWLGEPYWGRGIMTEAVRAVTAHAFNEFDLLRIFALPFADNTASIRVLEKAGFVIEGRMPQSSIKDGVVRDQVMYGAYRRS